jgi:hypothetical protein
VLTTDNRTYNFFLREIGWLIDYFIAREPTSRAPTPTPNAAISHPLPSAAFGCFTVVTFGSGVRAPHIAVWIGRGKGGERREVNMLFNHTIHG